MVAQKMEAMAMMFSVSPHRGASAKSVPRIALDSCTEAFRGGLKHMKNQPESALHSSDVWPWGNVAG
jgi:hypothetical protein